MEHPVQSVANLQNNFQQTSTAVSYKLQAMFQPNLNYSYSSNAGLHNLSAPIKNTGITYAIGYFDRLL